MNEFMPSSMFLVTAAFHGILAISALIRMKIRPIENPEDHTPFRAVPLERNSTATTMTLDPRADESASN
ncbi:MAG TPA: hypothetical protein ENK61_07995 [Devosia sp.]|nr:hypothetical protein [Devosia sp.]